MKLVEGGNCTIACFAMLLNTSYSVAEKHLPHDGNEIWWPDERGQMATRGMTVDELNDYLATSGLVLACYNLHPMAYSRDPAKHRPVYDDAIAHERGVRIITHGRGIITGLAFYGSLMQCGHAIAFEDGMFYDPRGHTSHHPPDDFGMQFAYRLAQLV